MPKRIENWLLTSLQQRLERTGGRLVKHARYYGLFWRKDIRRGGGLGRCWAGSRCYRYRRDRWIVVQSAAESVYKQAGVRRGVGKGGHKWRNFGLYWRRWQAVGSAADEKSFCSAANRRDGCNMVPFLRPRKEIPDGMVRRNWFLHYGERALLAGRRAAPVSGVAAFSPLHRMSKVR